MDPFDCLDLLGLDFVGDSRFPSFEFRVHGLGSAKAEPCYEKQHGEPHAFSHHEAQLSHCQTLSQLLDGSIFVSQWSKEDALMTRKQPYIMEENMPLLI